MANPDGTPIWYELMTTETSEAQAFYGDVVGWDIAPSNMPGAGDYSLLNCPDGAQAGGVMTLPDGAPVPPGWYGYIGVQDVDGTAERVKALGGTVYMGPLDIPDVGRFAFVADPQGLPFYIMRGDSPEDSAAFDESAPGHCSWNELVTTDLKAALDFYGQLFGWQNNESMPMGEMGDYCFIDTAAGLRIGAVMTAGAGWPTRWTYYFNVPSIAAVVEKVTDGGGRITNGPHEVPGGNTIIQGIDPQGAAFALVGGK